jgi:perosamine synthetase
VPSFTFIATANAVLHCGATPVFVDIDRRTYNLDPAKVEEAVSPRTQAIIPVDQIGLPADLDGIQAIARRHGLHVVEDAAPAMGAQYRGRRLGSLSELTCFSFHPRKVITTGEGGMITTNDQELATQARIGRSHGASISDLARHHADTVAIEEYPVLGFNYRMTDIQASIGIQQMRKLDWILERRRTLGERYTAALRDIEGLEPPFVPPNVEHTYQSYCVRIANGRHSRDEVMAAMMERHIATRRGVMAIHLEPYYHQRFGAVSLPVTEEVARTTLLLPLFPTMKEAEQDYVIESLRSVMVR